MTRDGLEFDHVYKTYEMGDDEVHALRDVSFSVAGGSMAVILGPSGSGKSTALNLIGGMDRATSGMIHMGDKDVTGLTERQLTMYRRRSVGFVFQFYNLIPSLTALENVDLVRSLGPGSLDPREMIAAVGLEKRCRHFPAELSGGELQRLSIARALCKNPDLLLCDEPTGALDTETGSHILSVLERMARRFRKTVIVVTHNAALAACADRIIHLRDGSIEAIEDNTHPTPVGEVKW